MFSVGHLNSTLRLTIFKTPPLFNPGDNSWFINLPENVTPTIQGRDFVIATVAAPTVVKEPEKPAEAEGEGGEATEAAADGDAKPEEGAEKAADGDKGKEEGKTPAEKK